MKTVKLSNEDMTLIRGALLKLEIELMNEKEALIAEGAEHAAKQIYANEKRCEELRHYLNPVGKRGVQHDKENL